MKHHEHVGGLSLLKLTPDLCSRDNVVQYVARQKYDLFLTNEAVGMPSRHFCIVHFLHLKTFSFAEQCASQTFCRRSINQA